MSVDSPAEPASGCPGWQNLTGELVEVLRHGQLYRRGRVDDAMPDGSALWIAAEGNAGRQLFWLGDGFSLRSVERRMDSPDSHENGGGIESRPAFSGWSQSPGGLA